MLSVALWAMGAAPDSAQEPHLPLRLIAPAAPGGGWDQTARVMQQVLLREGLASTATVENIPGAAGTIGLARFISAERGNGDVLMISGLIMLGAIVTHQSVLTLGDTTPIARVSGEYEVLAVPAASPFRTLADFIDAFRTRPEAISWGGGSAGGTDQILAGLVADAVGVDARRVNYIAFSGGGESMSAVLGGQVSIGVSGLAEFAPHIASGALRVLGISSPARVPGLDVPTLREQDVDVELENWRSVVAPPGIRAADRERLERTVRDMARSAAWREVLDRYRWNDRYLDGVAFARFIESEERRVQGILRKLGTGRTGTEDSKPAGPYPWLVLAGLGLSALAALLGAERVRAGVGRVPQGVQWRTLTLVGAALVLDVLLLEAIGFVLASTALFWLTARSFDARHPVRDAAFAFLVSMVTYLLFARTLDLPLPAGVLAAWI